MQQRIHLFYKLNSRLALTYYDLTQLVKLSFTCIKYLKYLLNAVYRKQMEAVNHDIVIVWV